MIITMLTIPTYHVTTICSIVLDKILQNVLHILKNVLCHSRIRDDELVVHYALPKFFFPCMTTVFKKTTYFYKLNDTNGDHSKFM